MSSKESMFVTVSFRQPLDEPMSVAEANNRIDWMEESVDAGWREFVAFAEGYRRLRNGEVVEVMLFLIYDHDEARYVVYENWTDEFEAAVLLDGDVQHDHRRLPPEQALAQWIGGFLARNEAIPRSHRLSYRLIKS